MVQVSILSLIVLSCLPLGQSYPNGAPQTACEDMFPLHGFDAQTSTPPFSIIISQDTYYPKSNNITVSIFGHSDASFKGFFLRARTADCRFEIPVGTFLDPKDSDVKLVSCGRNMGAVTHTSPVKKIFKEFTWMNPSGEDVYFQATFVKNYSYFWTGVHSSVLRDANKIGHIQHSPCPVKTRENMFPEVWTSGSSAVSSSCVLVLLVTSLLV